MFQFFQRRNAYADRGGGQDGAVEYIGQDMIGIQRRETAVEKRSDQKTESHWDDNARECDDDGGQADFLNLTQIGFQTGREQDQDDSDLG